MKIAASKLDTACVWAAEMRPFVHGATQVPVVHSVTFAHPDMDEWLAVARGTRPGYIYSRNANPAVAVLEEKMRVLEGAEAAASFATGMAAISTTLLALLSPGDRVVTAKDAYGGTSRMFLEILPRFGIKVALCNTTDFARIEKEAARGCALLYLETPTNPTLKIMDIRRLAQAARKAKAVSVVDNTFATPINQRPLELGADLVVYSATKFLCGHSDAMGGLLCGKSALVQRVFRLREILGSSLDPAAAYLVLRGVKTLALRMKRHNENALAVAAFLEAHPKVERVFYPGLESHPGHEIARRQMSGYGGVVSFSLKGGFKSVAKFLPRLKLAHMAAHLGSVETIAGPPKLTSHVEVTDEQRARLGIPESLIRYSAGIEDAADLIADLQSALRRI